MQQKTRYHFIDSHCHLDFIEGRQAREICTAAELCGVEHILVPGVSPPQWARLAELKAQGLPISFAVGVHPWWINQASLRGLEQSLFDAVEQFQPVAIGECGLDKRIETPLPLQREYFELQLGISVVSNLPVILHSVHMHADVLSMIKAKGISKGVIHAFNGSYELARAYWNQGVYLGVGGSITYERANKTRDAIRRMPLEALVLETDAPDMPIQGKQGQQNLPEYLPEIAQALADLKQVSLDEVLHKTRENTIRLFNLS